MHGLDDLLNALPRCADAPPLVEEPPPGIRYVQGERSEFVRPPLTVDQQELSEAQVVIISAPAAVGKSVLAEHIALRTGGVLWDLSRARVGNNYALGTLAAAHGVQALGGLLQAMWEGKFLVIADALDE